jgi:hypothetical protein
LKYKVVLSRQAERFTEKDKTVLVVAIDPENSLQASPHICVSSETAAMSSVRLTKFLVKKP